MTHDKKGYDIIKKGFEQDKARARLQIRQEIKEAYEKKNVQYLGSSEQQVAARKAEMIKMSNEIKQRCEESERLLAEKVWQGLGEQHFIEAYKREEKIQTVQQRFRNHNHNGLPRQIDKQQQPDSLTYAQNRAAEEGYDDNPQTRKEYLKQQWKQKDESQQQSQQKSENI